MDISRYTTPESSRISLGVIDDQRDSITPLETAAASLDEALTNAKTWESLRDDATGESIPLGKASLEAPVDRPANLIGIGLNYRGHGAEGGHENPEEPIFSAKSPSSITAPDSDLVLTGTPGGVGEMVPGDSVAVTVEGIGTLTNSVSER